MNKDCMGYWEEINDIRKERDITIAQVQQMDRDIEIKTLQYRMRSVRRVLDYINDKCWKKEEVKDLQTYIVHCINKLNGNIDGIELSLEDKE